MKLIENMRVILCVLLVLFSMPAEADWVKYAEDGAAVFYFDIDTIRKEDDVRKVWEFQDLKKRDKIGALSYSFRWEIDCKQKLFRRLAFSSHSEPQLGGNIIVLGSSQEDAMIPIASGSNIEAIRIRICAN